MKIIIKRIFKLIFWPEEPSKDNSKWPAIIFAVKRIARVSGRIINLMDSIITIKGIRMVGVPGGVKWERRLFKKLNILNIIILIHIFRDSDKQNLICLEAVKM